MSRTYHARRPHDATDQRAPKAPDERKRALYSFKTIHGVTTSRYGDEDANTCE